ncbi:MAG: [protein-PII] uridylyltransferase [Hellea sp.]|nr:[protein-PII] uridylyltransferase [Hellea sp.]
MSRRPIFKRKPKAPAKDAIPARAGAPKSGVSSKSLLKDLAQYGDDPKKNRPQILEALKQARQEGLESAYQKFELGRLGGTETAQVIATIHDKIVVALYHFTTDFVVEKPESKISDMTVCSVGGFGRREMAPHSDLDLLFLVPDKKGEEYASSVTEYILYMLWDLGLKVGQSIRTIDQNIQLAKTDQTILTALLDLRYICGDQLLAEKLFKKFRRNITRGKGRNYIAAKLKERDIRHDRAGNSRYVIEPNIKEGKGGLRDLHVLYWIARFLDTDGEIIDAQKSSNYVSMGLFDKKAATRFERAADFLWRARIQLHLESGRASETLSFDKQTALARKMGYASGPVEEAVEGFMREYFRNAREVGALTRIACAKLEAENSLRLPKGLDALLPNSRRKLDEPDFVLDHGRLMFDDPMQLRERPSLILQLFELAGKRNLDIHPDALSAINFRQNLIDNNFRRDPENTEIFKRILLDTKAPFATLKVMNEGGVLGRYLQEFGGIVARTQFNMHHAFTVDEHTLQLVNNYNDLETGDLAEIHPELTKIVTSFSDEERLSMYLACLLHDTGKGKGDQCIEGAQLARKACRRLNMSKEIKDNVSWLVRRHLDMSETAQRRDISNPETIAEFGKLIGSLKRLQMLYVLTVVDIKSVGPGIWNDWKGSLLRELYLATAAFLDGKASLEPAAKADAAREQFNEHLSDAMRDRIVPVTDELGDAYWTGFSMTALVRHSRFYDSIIESGLDSGVHTRVHRPQDVTELWVLTRDRVGLFSDITHAISACGAHIVGARLHTGLNDRVMDVFYLQNSQGLAFGRLNDHLTENIRRRVHQALSGKRSNVKPQTVKITRRAAAIPIAPKVRFIEKGVRQGQTIIEIEGRDRPGLLFALGDCLLKHKISIFSAHIEVVGNRAIDAFYVSGPSGRLTKTQKKKLRDALIDVLEFSEKAKAA